MRRAAKLVSATKFCVDVASQQPTPNEKGITCTYSADGGKLTSVEVIATAPNQKQIIYSLEDYPLQGQTYAVTSASRGGKGKYTEQGGEDNGKPGHYREYMVQGTEQASDTTRYDEAATEYAPSDDPIWLQRDDQLATAILAGMQSVL